MSDKLKTLLKNWPRGEVYTAHYIYSLGYSYDLLSKYRESGWIVSLGNGAYHRADDGTPAIEAGVAALRKQLGLMVHVGGRSALELYGATNQVPLGQQVCFLYGSPSVRLPKWFTQYKWSALHFFNTTNLFGGDEELGVTWQTNYQRSPVSFPCSTRERAFLERLLTVRDEVSLEDRLNDMYLQSDVDPKHLQTLLEKCRSVKVKRVFLYLAEQAQKKWFLKLDLGRINLGSGVRQIAKRNSMVHKRFMITVDRPIPFKDIP